MKDARSKIFEIHKYWMIPWTLGFFTTPPSSSTNVRRIDKLSHGRFKLQNFLTESFLEPQCRVFFCSLLCPSGFWSLRLLLGLGLRMWRPRAPIWHTGFHPYINTPRSPAAAAEDLPFSGVSQDLQPGVGALGAAGPSLPMALYHFSQLLWLMARKMRPEQTSPLTLMADLGNTLKTSLVLEHNRLMWEVY